MEAIWVHVLQMGVLDAQDRLLSGGDAGDGGRGCTTDKYILDSLLSSYKSFKTPSEVGVIVWIEVSIRLPGCDERALWLCAGVGAGDQRGKYAIPRSCQQGLFRGTNRVETRAIFAPMFE